MVSDFRTNHWRRLPRPAVLAFVLAVAAAPCAMAQGIGIVITKESTAHPDSTSIAFEFKRIRRQSEVTTYYLPSGKSVRLTMFDPQVVVYYPELEATQITSSEQVAVVSRLARHFREIIRTYPKSEPFLKPHLDLSEEIARRVAAGDVYIEGSFMKKPDYEMMISQVEQVREETLHREREEKRRSEEQTRRQLIEERRRKR